MHRVAHLPLLALCLGLTGCPIYMIREKPVPHDEPVREYESVEVSKKTEVVAFVPSVDDCDSDSVRVRVSVKEEHTCKRTEHRIVDRTMVTEREVDDRPLLLQIMGYTFGALGFDALVSGAITVGVHEDESTDSENDPVMMAGGALLALGILGTLYGIANVSYDLAAIDTSEHVGLVEMPFSSSSETCESRPYAGQLVVLRAPTGEVLFSGLVPPEGVLEQQVPRERIRQLGPRYDVRVAPPGTPPEEATRHVGMTASAFAACFRAAVMAQ
jgi:hypothetical protein